MISFYLSSLFLLSLCSKALGQSNMSDVEVSALGIALIVLAVYIVIDIVLAILICWCCGCCRRNKGSHAQSKTLGVHFNRSGSIEFVDAAVTLHIRRRKPSAEEEEDQFFDTSETASPTKLEDVQSSAREGKRENVFEEEHLVTPEHQRKLHEEHKKSLSRSHNSAVRKNSQTFLLGRDDKSDEEDSDNSLKKEDLANIDESHDDSDESHDNIDESRDLSPSPEPHLVSIASKITGPIIPGDVPIGDVPRDLQSLKFNDIAQAQGDAGALVQETGFNKSYSFISHEKTGSELSNGGLGPAGHSSTYLTPPSSEFNLHTVSGASLGYSEVERQVKNINLDIGAILKQSKESLQHSPSHQLSPSYQLSPGHQQSRYLTNSQTTPILPLYSPLAFNIGSGNNTEPHQRSSSLSLTPTQHMAPPSSSNSTGKFKRISTPEMNVTDYRKQHNLLSSQSATPTHNFKFQ